jgi:hypothetical protein
MSSQFIEIMGIVNPDLSVQEMVSANFGDTFGSISYIAEI